MTNLEKCPSCNKTFSNNPSKHKYRPKYCPYCLTPYTTGQRWMPTFNFNSAARQIQKIFSFLGSKKKDVVYLCPNCEQTFSEGEFAIDQYPDKYKDVPMNGQIQKVAISYREIPTCKKCSTHLIRRSKKIEH